MGKWKKLCIAAVAAAVMPLCGVARATPLVNLYVLGSTSQNGTYTSTLSNLQAGQTIYIEVTGGLSAVGTVDGSQTISSTTTSANNDGIISLSFNLTSSDSGSTFLSSHLATGSTTPPTTGLLYSAGTAAAWNGTSSQSGSVSGSTATNIAPNTGSFADLGTLPGSTDVLALGTLSVGSASIATVSASWDAAQQGDFHINAGTGSGNIFITGTTETGGNPYVGYSALTLSDESPEPTGGVLIVGAATLGLLRRSRRRWLV